MKDEDDLMATTKPVTALQNSPGHMLRRAGQYAADVFAQNAGKSGLTPRQFAVLQAVHKNEGLSQTDLVNLTGIDRSTLADMVSRLIAKNTWPANAPKKTPALIPYH